MSLFNTNLEVKKDMKALNESKKLNLRKKLASTLICEDDYLDIFRNAKEINLSVSSDNPHQWSYLMKYFVDSLNSYINNDREMGIRTLQMDLYRIPIENIEERLTAGLEFFKAILMKKVNLDFCEAAEKFLENTIDIYLKSRPNPVVIESYTDKINCIKELIQQTNYPGAGKLLFVLDKLVYKFVDYGYLQTKVERLGNISEEVVANIAPIINNSIPNNIPQYEQPDYVVDKLLGNTQYMSDLKNRIGNHLGEKMVGTFEKQGTGSVELNTMTPSVLGEAYLDYLMESYCDQIEQAVFNESITTMYHGMKSKVSKVIDKVNDMWETAKEQAKHFTTQKEDITKAALTNSGFLDQRLSVLFTKAIGTLTVTAISPLLGLYSVLFQINRFRDVKEREKLRILSRLNEELMIVREKIQDNQGNLEKKYLLMRLEKKIAKMIEAIREGRNAKDVEDQDMKGFYTDENRIVQKARRSQKEREERYRREDKANGYNYDKDKVKDED